MTGADDTERRLIAMQWSLTTMARAFRDLAAAFGAVDGKSADNTIRDIEKMLVAEFDAMLKKPPEGVSVADLRAIFAEVVPPFRNMTQEARALIQQAGKPKN